MYMSKATKKYKQVGEVKPKPKALSRYLCDQERIIDSCLSSWKLIRNFQFKFLSRGDLRIYIHLQKHIGEMIKIKHFLS